VPNRIPDTFPKVSSLCDAKGRDSYRWVVCMHAVWHKLDIHG